jgi:hypothetical protein
MILNAVKSLLVDFKQEKCYQGKDKVVPVLD